jgi:hypothetical protein
MNQKVKQHQKSCFWVIFKGQLPDPTTKVWIKPNPDPQHCFPALIERGKQKRLRHFKNSFKKPNLLRVTYLVSSHIGYR